MDLIPNDLLVFFVRWLHVLAGIMWIGNSFYFMWLDANLSAPESSDPKVEGSLWMVHSGGFYQVEKRRIEPGSMPKLLHWFKWEATFTWLTGFLMLTLIFYMRGAVLLIDPQVLDIQPAAAIGISIGTLIVAWLAYDLLWTSRLQQQPVIVYGLSLVLTLIVVIGGCLVFSGRGAFIHLGAVYGTLMVLNVWVRILPAQRAMISATERGETPDYSLGKQAKNRSTHNSYMTLPVLFAMLAAHMPGAAGHHYNWAVILLFIVIGMVLRHAMVLHTFGKAFKWWLVAATLLVGGLFWLLDVSPSRGPVDVADHVSEEEAFAIVQRRCVSCHAVDPVDATFGPAPGGISFEHMNSISLFADKIDSMAVKSNAMPLINKTNMTDAERQRLGIWTKKVLGQ